MQFCDIRAIFWLEIQPRMGYGELVKPPSQRKKPAPAASRNLKPSASFAEDTKIWRYKKKSVDASAGSHRVRQRPALGTSIETQIEKMVHSAKDKGYDVVPCRVNIYDFLQKILKEIAQNLQHGSIF
jgi:hypothetical protein